MIHIQELQKNEHADLFAQIGLAPVADMFFSDPYYKGIILGIFEQREFTGFFLVEISSANTEELQLCKMFVCQQYRSKTFVLDAIQKCIEFCRHIYSVNFFCWTYELYYSPPIMSTKEISSDDQNVITAIEKILSLIKTIETESFETEVDLYFSVKQMDTIKKLRWFVPEVLIKKGFACVPWKNVDESIIQLIRFREENENMNADYLSPFFDFAVDGDCSFLLYDEINSCAAGWIMCSPINDEEILIKRFYVYDRYRCLTTSPILGSCCLREIEKKYTKFVFKVELHNHPMKRFVRSFLLPLADYCVLHKKVNIALVS